MHKENLAVIVGYGPGIAASTALALMADGHPLALIARDGAKLAQAETTLTAKGARLICVAADASDPSQLNRALQEATSAFGEPGVLLYNAARWRPGPVLAMTPESLIEDFWTDVGGALVAARAVAPSMIERGAGTILFTGGGLALSPSPDAPSLSIGKAGLRALARMLAEELAPKGVRVGTVTVAGMVAPGTPFAPEHIAKALLSLHRTPPDPATAEIVFRGATAHQGS